MASVGRAKDKHMRPFFSKIAAFLKPKRRWFQFSVRFLLLLTAAVAVWLGFTMKRVRDKEEAVRAIHDLGGTVRYDYQYDADWNFLPNASF